MSSYTQGLATPLRVETLFTSRMKNLAVFTLAQVFFSLETGLMFMPARRRCIELGGLVQLRQSPLFPEAKRSQCALSVAEGCEWVGADIHYTEVVR